MATDYFTKWIEASPLKRSSSNEVIKFLEEVILSRFGVPSKLVTDNRSYFISLELLEFCNKFGIEVSHSANYYPQSNGLAKASNKILITRTKRALGKNKRD